LAELLREEEIPHFLTFLDSPMAIDVTQVFCHYQSYFDEEMLDLVRNGNFPLSN